MVSDTQSKIADTEFNIRHQVMSVLTERGLNVNKLTRMLGMSKGHVYKIFNGDREFTEVFLSKINYVLNTNFTLENACTD